MKLKPINELFDIKYGNQFDLNKLSPAIASNEGIAFVSRTSKNNGVVAKVQMYQNIQPFPKGLITVTLGGTYLLSAFVQQKAFYTAQNIKVLTPKTRMTLKEKLFYCTAIRHNRFRYASHGREANKTFDTITVPDLKEVSQLVAKHIIPKQPSTNPYKNLKLSLSDRNWKWFLYKNVFLMRGGYYNKKPETSLKGSVPFIGATEYNNGITSLHTIEDIENSSKDGRSKNEQLSKKIYKGNKYITISNNGSVGYAFYQPNDFTCSHDVTCVFPRDEKISLNPFIAMFLCSLISLEKFRWSYGRKWRPARMPHSIIKLPVDSKDNPDWQFMEDYIKSLPLSSSL